MREPGAAASGAVAGCRLARRAHARLRPAFWRFLYARSVATTTGSIACRGPTDEIRAYLRSRGVHLAAQRLGIAGRLLRVAATTTGALRSHTSDCFEHFHGRGLGGHFLTQAVQPRMGSRRHAVWLHTNTFDHPAALPNYLKRGFKVFKTENFFRVSAT